MNVEREEGYCCSSGFNSSWNRWSHTIGAQNGCFTPVDFGHKCCSASFQCAVRRVLPFLKGEYRKIRQAALYIVWNLRSKSYGQSLQEQSNHSLCKCQREQSTEWFGLDFSLPLAIWGFFERPRRNNTIFRHGQRKTTINTEERKIRRSLAKMLKPQFLFPKLVFNSLFLSWCFRIN